VPLPSGREAPFPADYEVVPFNATTTGSRDGTIAKGADWAWGLVLARRTAGSPWLVVDQGVG
jgi:hypothetical protein